MNQEEIDMITWRIDRDSFVLAERKINFTELVNDLYNARDEGFIAGLKWVRDGDMQKCIEDNKISEVSS